MGKRVIFGIVILAGLAMLAASPAFARVSRIIDDHDTMVLSGNTHPLARPEFDMGATDANLSMERMVLSLRLARSKQSELDRFLAEQQDPASPNFHHWLAPEEFGARFGPKPDEVTAITDWLTSHGFAVAEVAKGRTWINFSGTVSEVNRVFHTKIHDYYIDGRVHHANAGDPAIPRGLADLVAGVVSLHNFPRKAMNTGLRSLAPVEFQPYYTAGNGHYLAPGDFATIYNVNPLYSAGIDGTGQSIAIVGRTHPSSSNWATFRSIMGLAGNPPQVIVNGADPGDLGAAEDLEADLDIEWAGAVAKNATIKFVVSRSTSSTDGVDLSAQYIVNNNLAPAMSTSFGLCESLMGSADNAFYNNLWSQAAAQGITSFVASADSGAAGCSASNATTGSALAVNGLASTPYNVAVGGTQFNEGFGSYWNAINGTTYTSAISYIPEVAWNESGIVSGGSGLWATGGGVSSIYGKPSWQVSPGVPADGKRDVPDVSLSAAGHDAYLVVTQGALYAVGGTSASSPSFAGLMALIVQKTGQRQGNANIRLYQLANAQYGSGGATVFHDIVAGNNSVPGVPGYSCTAGYDPATGLGSVDANALVNNWAGPTIPDFAISASPVSVSAVQGKSGTTTISTAVSGGFSNTISLSASGFPAGVTAVFNPATISAPSSGSSTLTLTAGASTAPGTYTVTITGTGGSTTHTATITFTVMASGGSTTLFSDGFEGSGWSTAQVSGNRGKWTLAGSGSHPSASPHGETRLADFNSYFAASGNRTRLYRTTGFTVPTSYPTVTLKFWMYHDTGYPSYNDRVQAQVSTNRTTWTNVGSAVSRYNGTTGWAQVSIDVSSFKGQTLYLGFVGISAYGNDEYLDDVSVVAQ